MQLGDFFIYNFCVCFKFVYNLNVPSRWGQSPFSNITIDWYVPKTLKDLGPTRNSRPYFMHIVYCKPGHSVV